MNDYTKRMSFLAIVGVLSLAIVALAIFLPKSAGKSNGNTGTSVIDSSDGTITIKDIYEGEIKIPEYPSSVKLNQYNTDSFGLDDKGIVTYQDQSRVGINVNSKNGDIDWQQVKDSGVSFAMIRVGYRGPVDGEIYFDTEFNDNMQGATDAGIDIGVYFYSHAITEEEAVKEAEFVLEKIQTYQVTYPIAIVWEFVDESKTNGVPRTNGMQNESLSRILKAFCARVEQPGFDGAYFTGKQVGYEFLDLEALKDYDMWYMEYRKLPAFYYNFTIWQYSSEGEVPGIEGSVKMNFSFVDYAR